MVRPKHTQKLGFNLLEVMIAGFLFSTVAVAFLGVWGMQIRAVEKSRHQLVATMLAEEMIEEIMSGGYEQNPPTTVPKETVIPMEIEHRGPEGNWATIPVTYTSTVEITTYIGDPPDPDDRLRQVRVTVVWEDSTKTGKVELSTYLAGVS